MIQKLREYFIPMIAAAVTAITVATAAICTFLVGRDTLGIPLTVLALGLYLAGLIGIFIWVRLRFRLP